jgi:hypothetical protein
MRVSVMVADATRPEVLKKFFFDYSLFGVSLVPRSIASGEFYRLGSGKAHHQYKPGHGEKHESD